MITEKWRELGTLGMGLGAMGKQKTFEFLCPKKLRALGSESQESIALDFRN